MEHGGSLRRSAQLLRLAQPSSAVGLRGGMLIVARRISGERSMACLRFDARIVGSHGRALTVFILLKSVLHGRRVSCPDFTSGFRSTAAWGWNRAKEWHT